MDAPPIQYVKTSDGFDIAYCVSGDGMPLIMMPEPFNHLHLMWASPVYRSLYEPLAARFRLIQFDARGQGLSGRGLGAEHTHRSHVKDLEAVVQASRATRFVLYGGYYFGTVAAEYTVHQPQHVAGLVLWNIETGGPLLQAPIIYDLSSRSWDLFLETYARTFNSYEGPEAAITRLRAATDQRDFGQGRDPSWDIPATLSSVSVPTLVIAGRGSSLPLEERGKQVTALVPDSRLVLTDDITGGRYTGDGSTPALVSAIESFVATLPDAGATSANDVREPHDKDVLSSREAEVLRLLATGRSNQQIADELVISLNTVRRHVSNIFDKTGAANRVEASAYARDHGLA
jgi:DNA-binding CsgD family transcriptional regulator/pimeloyl-ACP methyl ester carboxylesterase